MSLPDSWVDRIFARLLVRYGAAWLRMWEGVPMEAVKADWGTELGGLTGEALQHALENLPADKPPTVTQFKALACNRVSPAPPSLPAPKADPGRVASIVANLRQPQRQDPKAWARRLRDIELNHGGVMVQDGRRRLMTPAARAMWREALEVGSGDGARIGEGA